MDLKITLAKALGWSLHEINQTDIMELLHFVKRFNETAGGTKNGGKPRKVFIDQAGWA